MYSCIVYYPSLPLIGAGSVFASWYLAVSVCVSVILSWSKHCSCCLCLRESLLVCSLESLSVSQGAVDISGDGGGVGLVEYRV